MSFCPIKEKIEKYQSQYFSQLKQDVAALVVSNFKKHGFFVEFGACDGVHLSNTLLLETRYEWKGILSEPSIKFNSELARNRSATVDKRAVYSVSGQILNFKETDSQLDLSGLASSLPNDNHVKKRRNGTVYEVETVSLSDLLRDHAAPFEIDFLSIDTEGTEYEIIRNFNFQEYQINFITIEHNYIEDYRNKIQNYLEQNDFTRILTSMSEWDDWYISNKVKDKIYEKDIGNSSY